jgi:hypothetical protein
MRTPSARLAAEGLRTWSAAYVPPGTPIRHTINTDDPEIRLILGTENPVELVMEPGAANEVATHLRRAIREFHGTCDHPPNGSDAA